MCTAPLQTSPHWKTKTNWKNYKTRCVFREGLACACPSPRHSADPNFDDCIFAVLLIFPSKMSKFRHLLTKSLSFWRLRPLDPLPGLCPGLWTPLRTDPWPGAFLAAAVWGGQWGGHICIWGWGQEEFRMT